MIQSVKFDADKKLLDFVEHKVNKLEKLSDDILGSEVILKIDKDHDLGNKVAVVKLDITGGDIVAERKSKSFEESVDQCVDALKRQIEKRKEKIASLAK